MDAGTRESTEARLAREGSQVRPGQLAGLADGLADRLNPDGTYTDEDRARRRGLTLGKQHADGMSEVRGWLTPKPAPPSRPCWPSWPHRACATRSTRGPCVDATPTQAAIDSDRSSGPASATMTHSNAALQSTVGVTGKLGQHNGLPASIIVTTTLTELEAAAGRGLTGGGTILPMSDVIRLARHARHYLAIFDHGKALALYHTKRLASPGQRIVLYAKDRGCSAPGCTVPGYYCEVHHVTDYAKCRETDVNELTFCCGPQHRIVQPGGWSTRKNTKGDTEWIPPPTAPTAANPRTNTFHHPEKLLRGGDDDDEW